MTTDWNKPPDAFIALMKEFPKYAKYFAACKYKPTVTSEYYAHFQTFQVMEEGTTDSLLRRVKSIIRGKVRSTSSLAKKWHKDESIWTSENWIAAYKSVDKPE